ncbi:hypothetical protein SASPL_124662 [Salvia splendens]|uniref:valine--tRNA ligase n=1 Tax=Salvia splendens TaxID=180675 RepID=A0A8X8XCH5_SALSN|nr:hypothetical protein SASPL_124662 [Salvia splendens]
MIANKLSFKVARRIRTGSSFLVFLANNDASKFDFLSYLWIWLRDKRLVAWDCRMQTTLSKTEFKDEYIKERTLHGYETEVEFGVLTSFAYPLEGDLGEIVVATTRVETMLGDTAVAMHPDDPRCMHLHGKFTVHPFNGRKLNIICDSFFVDMKFGTGAVKITPAHDPDDYEVGKCHDLDCITIFTDDGKINSNGGEEFEGMAHGLHRGDKDNEMCLKICSTSNEVVEYLVKPQWFVSCKGMAEDGLNAVIGCTNPKLGILPKQYVAEWQRWLENIRDWCISRQIWWGHPFMPFMTEDLWQRLPSKMDSVRKESIVISEYPSLVKSWTNDDVESEMDGYDEFCD